MGTRSIHVSRTAAFVMPTEPVNRFSVGLPARMISQLTSALRSDGRDPRRRRGGRPTLGRVRVSCGLAAARPCAGVDLADDAVRRRVAGRSAAATAASHDQWPQHEQPLTPVPDPGGGLYRWSLLNSLKWAGARAVGVRNLPIEFGPGRRTVNGRSTGSALPGHDVTYPRPRRVGRPAAQRPSPAPPGRGGLRPPGLGAAGLCDCDLRQQMWILRCCSPLAASSSLATVGGFNAYAGAADPVEVTRTGPAGCPGRRSPRRCGFSGPARARTASVAHLSGIRPRIRSGRRGVRRCGRRSPGDS
jgi:hypothetical protein